MSTNYKVKKRISKCENKDCDYIQVIHIDCTSDIKARSICPTCKSKLIEQEGTDETKK